MPNDYRIGSVVEYRVGDTLRQCEVEERGWRDSEAQENDPTFDGQLVKDGKAASAAEPGLPATGVWGYDRQIIRVVKILMVVGSANTKPEAEALRLYLWLRWGLRTKVRERK